MMTTRKALIHWEDMYLKWEWQCMEKTKKKSLQIMDFQTNFTNMFMDSK